MALSNKKRRLNWQRFFGITKLVYAEIMNRSDLTAFRVWIWHVRRFAPSWPRTLVAGVALAAVFVCCCDENLIAQQQGALRIPSEPISFGAGISRYQPKALQPAAFVNQASAKSSAATAQDDQRAYGRASDQRANDEATASLDFKIASVNDPISSTPFSKLKLPGKLPLENDQKEAAVVQFGNMPVVFSPETYFVLTATPEMPRTFAWKSPDFYHRPLYFDESNLERYGHHVPLVQPALSAAHFFVRIPNLPYLVGTYPPCERTYTYGHYRPGSCNPHQWSRAPLSFQGLLLKGVVATGLVFALP